MEPHTGGQSVWLHLTNDESSTHIKRAISMSAPNGVPFMNLDEADSMYQQVSKNLTCCQSMIGDCDVDIDCLRSKTTEQIQIAAFGLANALKNTYVPIIRTGKLTQLAEPFAPVIDGIVVKDDPFNLISNKQFKKNVPILYDYSHNEGDTFIMQIFGMNLTQDKGEVKILGWGHSGWRCFHGFDL